MRNQIEVKAIKKQTLSVESVYRSLKMFDQVFDKMTDSEKKSFVQTIIDRIELYPDKNGNSGCPIKTVHFKFPVFCEGEAVSEITPHYLTTDETCVLLSKETCKPKEVVSIKVDLDGIKDRF